MRPSLLLVEDDKDIRDTLKDLLEEEGFEIAPAANGKAAADFLDSTVVLPRLIFLDLSMPVMDGRQFRAWQLAQDRYRGIPTYILSAAGNGGDEAARLSAAGFMRKPFDLDRLLELIRPYRET